VWPSEYDEDYLFGDYTYGGIFRFTPEEGGRIHAIRVCARGGR
jgi:hypothetical protein